MRALYAHDHRFIPLGEAVYSNVSHHAASWETYLHAFEEIRVVARRGVLRAGQSSEALVRSSRAGLTFQFAPDLSSPLAQLVRRRQARAVLREGLAAADALIARLPSQIGLLAVAEARRLGKPWAAEVAGCAWDGLWNYGNWQGRLYAPVMFWRMRSAVAGSPFAAYVTRDFLQRRYPSPGADILACSDVEIPAASKDVLARRLERIRLAPRPFVFGLIGTLRGQYKGIQTVLAALGKTRGQLPAFAFRILGGGDPEPWRAMARRMGLGEVVFFDGTLPAGEAVLQWLDGVDIYLQPSFKEGLPRALVEAMSRGCPAIASTCGGIPELLQPDCLIRPGDTGALARWLLRAAADPAWRCEQAHRNWETSQNFVKEILDRRRRAFWRRFADFARERKTA